MKENTAALMQAIAQAIDDTINPNGKKNAFVVLVAPFGGPDGARTNYVSNADRADIVVMLKEVVARFEGQPELKGTA